MITLITAINDYRAMVAEDEELEAEQRALEHRLLEIGKQRAKLFVESERTLQTVVAAAKGECDGQESRA